MIGWATLAAVAVACSAASLLDSRCDDHELCVGDATPASGAGALLQARQDVRARQSQQQVRERSVCFFVSTSTFRVGEYRDRAAAVADTWAADVPDAGRVFYIVDESAPPYHLPTSVREEQVVKAVAEDYQHLAYRTRLVMVALNSREYKEQCEWFALVDDDTYVNSASIVSKAKRLNSSQVHYMGAEYLAHGEGWETRFVHGDFILLSAAAIPVIAGAVARCDDWGYGRSTYDDVELGRCFASLNLTDTLYPEEFGVSVEDNSEERPSTLQEAIAVSNKSNCSLACLDYLHKMFPEDMRAFHERMKASSPCTATSSSISKLRIRV